MFEWEVRQFDSEIWYLYWADTAEESIEQHIYSGNFKWIPLRPYLLIVRKRGKQIESTAEVSIKANICLY